MTKSKAEKEQRRHRREKEQTLALLGELLASRAVMDSIPGPMLFLMRSQVKQLAKKSEEEFHALLVLSFKYCVFGVYKIAGILGQQVIVTEMISDEIDRDKAGANRQGNLLWNDGDGQDDVSEVSLARV
jgi:hypothetical protein